MNAEILKGLAKVNQDVWQAGYEQGRKIPDEVARLLMELRRTMDEGHWFADDLDRAIRLLNQEIPK